MHHHNLQVKMNKKGTEKPLVVKPELPPSRCKDCERDGRVKHDIRSSSYNNFPELRVQKPHPNKLRSNTDKTNIEKTRKCISRKCIPRYTNLYKTAHQNSQPMILDNQSKQKPKMVENRLNSGHLAARTNVSSANPKASTLRPSKIPVRVGMKKKEFFDDTVNLDPHLVAIQDLQPLKSKTTVRLSKTETNIDNKPCVLDKNDIDKNLPLFYQKNKTLQIKIDNGRASGAKEKKVCFLLPVYLQSDTSEINKTIEMVKASTVNLKEFKLFSQAMFNFSCKINPQIVQLWNEKDSQEITITFNCHLKSYETNSIPNEITENIYTQNSSKKLNLKELETIVSKVQNNHECIPYNNQLLKKIGSQNLFRFISYALFISKYVSNRSQNKVLALHSRNWHFQNIAQGYLLRLLLSNSNIHTLNVMRGLYFIIIAINSPNLYLDVNFVLKNEIFMLDGSAGDFDDSTVTEKGSVCSLNSESTLGDGVGWFERDIPIIDNGTFENEINTSSSDLYSNTRAITFYEEFESVERLCDSLPSTRTSRCTIIIAGNKCTATSTIFSLHSLSSAQQKQMIDRAAEVELSGLEKYQLKFNDWLFGFLLSKRFNVSNKLLSHFEKYFSNNNNFDETMFERVTVVEKYFNVVAEQCASPDFSRVFLTSLSHTIGCSLMSFFLTFL